MKALRVLGFSLVGFVAGHQAQAQTAGLAKPDLVERQVVEGMPSGARQEISILTARFQPGDKTVFHSHRHPVAVYVIEGAFTLEMEGRSPMVVKAGQGYVEPPKVVMTGYNRSATEPLKVVIFYVGDPDTPFLDMAH